MNILLINSFYYPNMMGGTEHSIKLLAEGLKKNDNNVCVYTVDSGIKSSSGPVRDEMNGVLIYRGYKWNFTKLFFSKGIINRVKCIIVNTFLGRTRKDLDYIMNVFSPDIVHVNNVYGISFGMWKYFHKKGIRVVHTIRDYHLSAYRTNNMLARLVCLYWRRLSCDYVDVVTAPSEFTINSFLSEGYFDCARRKCIVNSIEFDEKEVRSIIKSKIELRSDNITFLFVGSLSNNKGIDILLKAFGMVKNEKIRLVICGTGELKDEVLKEVMNDKRMVFKGQLDSDELACVYKMADVLIVPSVWDEPFGRVVIEGNQYGLVVIGSKRAGIKETVDFMKCGECFEPKFQSELIDAIIRFSDRDYYKKYLFNIEHNLKHYSIDLQVKEFLKCFEM